MEGFRHAIVCVGGAYRPADHILVSALLGLSADSAAGPPDHLLAGACNCSITWSMVKLAAFCRGGYSLNVARNWPT